MKKPNRRSKRTSVAASSSPAKTIADDDRHRKEESVPQTDYAKRVSELEEENRSLKREVLELKDKAYNATPDSSNRFPKSNSPNFHALQEQVTDLKKKVEVQYQFSMRKVIDSEGKRGPQDEIQRLKAQKVQLLCKMKLESVQFRISKASLEKEVLRLKKEQWKYKYEMRKLLALNQSQKLVLQRKTEEASTAAKRLNDILESRKNSSRRTSGTKSGSSPGTQGEFERKLATRVEEIRADYERQMEEMAEELRKYEEEAETLKEENFRLMLQDKELDCMARDSELKELKDEVIRLGHMVAHIITHKTQAPIKTQQMDTISCSPSAGSHIKEKVDTSQSCGGSVAGTGKSRSVCCSCSKKSSCKTLKCECRAAGGGCGSQCGCSTAKCANRQVVRNKTGDTVQQPEVQNLIHCIGSSVGENIVTTCGPAAMKDASETSRMALQDIGNMQDNPAVGKPRPRTRKPKPPALRDSADAPDKMAGLDVPQKLKRATRAAVADRTS